ncbi:MAG TPA: cell wall-binding repeat-containing protein [Micromonosporaceae bacterium]
MARRSLRKPLAVATVLATVGLSVVGVRLAMASHSGTGATLTSSDGTTSIKVAGGSALTTSETITDATWSPDGSRALFVNGAGEIMTVRYNDGADTWWIADAVAGTTRQHPTWRGDGAGVVWSERTSSSLPWHLALTSSSYGGFVGPISPDDGYNYTHPDAGPGRLVAFQRQADSSGTPTGAKEVWLYDPDAGSTPATRISKITDGGNPALSPDGTQVAYVLSDGTYNQIMVCEISSCSPTAVTADAANHDNPVWSPDSGTIAFTTGASAIAVAPADGSGADSPTPVDGVSGKPAYRPGNLNHVVRLAGSSRFGTAVAVSKSHWTTADTPDTRATAESVVLSRSDNFADALSGSALAAAKVGPLLMTPPSYLHTETKAEIARVLGTSSPASKTVYLLGGTGAISAAVQTEVAGMGYNVVRLAGANRFETSIAIANAITADPDLILAATGMNFPDALAAGAAAGSYDVPGTGASAVVVLTADTNLPTATANYLNAHPTADLYAIGGQAATATAAYNSFVLSGANRYVTALYTAEVFFGGENVAGVATGSNWPDALAGGALMATLNGPLLLTPSANDVLRAETAFLLDVTCGSISTGLIFGGTAVVSAAIDNQIGDWISGPAGFDTTTNPGGTSLTLKALAVRPGATSTALDTKPTREQLKANAERVMRLR